MRDISLLIGGKAGDGINQSGLLLSQLLAQLGYFVYMYFDYPSLIRGGHNFAIIRASEHKITSHRDEVDYLLALNQDTVNFHSQKLKDNSHIIYDSETVESAGVGLALGAILKEENAKPIMRNSLIIGAFARAIGIERQVLESVVRKYISRETDLNLKLALRGFEVAKELDKIEPLQRKSYPVFTGNEVIALGLLQAGLKTYIAYPMTPSSGLLHFLAKVADDFSLKVIHPENEIGVILMALGFSYTGERVAIGTSGGGFCLMTEGLSLAAMAELPVVILVAQRPAPSTGVPTYTAQGDLNFVLNAGHGEFVRFVVAPGDAEQSFYWSGVALNIAWKYQIPSIILTDKVLSEGSFSFDIEEAGKIKEEEPLFWDRKDVYRRYLDTTSGISPLAFVPDKEAIIKANSYEHDERGITTEDPGNIAKMCLKRLRKGISLKQEMDSYEGVKVYGTNGTSVALLCWGSNVGVCREVASRIGMKVIQPIVLSPFPLEEFKKGLEGVRKIIVVENNATGQLAELIGKYGFNVDEKILKFDGRPFSLDELERKVKMVI
jgi:2-oxoglutarate ferredoxin oxidoreductase subunit alpha